MTTRSKTTEMDWAPFLPGILLIENPADVFGDPPKVESSSDVNNILRGLTWSDPEGVFMVPHRKIKALSEGSGKFVLHHVRPGLDRIDFWQMPLDESNLTTWVRANFNRKAQVQQQVQASLAPFVREIAARLRLSEVRSRRTEWHNDQDVTKKAAQRYPRIAVIELKRNEFLTSGKLEDKAAVLDWLNRHGLADIKAFDRYWHCSGIPAPEDAIIKSVMYVQPTSQRIDSYAAPQLRNISDLSLWLEVELADAPGLHCEIHKSILKHTRLEGAWMFDKEEDV